MIKSFIAASAATIALAGSAVAGPYINAERNDGFVGSDHGGAINEVHVGIEGELTPTITGYAQAGPAYLQPSVGSGEIEFSGKAGASVALGGRPAPMEKCHSSLAIRITPMGLRRELSIPFNFV